MSSCTRLAVTSCSDPCITSTTGGSGEGVSTFLAFWRVSRVLLGFSTTSILVATKTGSTH